MVLKTIALIDNDTENISLFKTSLPATNFRLIIFNSLKEFISRHDLPEQNIIAVVANETVEDITACEEPFYEKVRTLNVPNMLMLGTRTLSPRKWDYILIKPVTAKELTTRIIALIRLKKSLQQQEMRRRVGSLFEIKNPWEPIRRANILLVEDSRLESVKMAKMLEEEDFFVTTATTGEVALEALSRDMYDLILLDIVLPTINGYDVLKKLKQNPETYNIPVFMLTGLVP